VHNLCTFAFQPTENTYLCAICVLDYATFYRCLPVICCNPLFPTNSSETNGLAARIAETWEDRADSGRDALVLSIHDDRALEWSGRL
jgi:hypothetical protein